MAFFTYIHAKFLLKSEQNPKKCCKFANKKRCVFDNIDQIKNWNHHAVVPILSKFPYTRTFSSPFFISRDKKRVEVTP